MIYLVVGLLLLLFAACLTVLLVSGNKKLCFDIAVLVAVICGFFRKRKARPFQPYPIDMLVSGRMYQARNGRWWCIQEFIPTTGY